MNVGFCRAKLEHNLNIMQKKAPPVASLVAMNLGETYLVTEDGNERLGKQKLDLVIL